MSSRGAPWPPIPKEIKDEANSQTYQIGKLLGKGGFAKVHAFTPVHVKQDRNTGQYHKVLGNVVAGKIVARMLLTKAHQKEKMHQEIELHKSLTHPNIVQFYHNFITTEFVIITLELCAKRSLMELHKRRGKILEPEARFYMSQVQKGVIGLGFVGNLVHRSTDFLRLFTPEIGS